MPAYYLLGRAYHEHGEAPMALQCYHDAIDCADTTAADCDYAQLATFTTDGGVKRSVSMMSMTTESADY